LALKIKLNQTTLLASYLCKLNLGNDILAPTQINSDSIRESLSAVMDDAAQPLELQRVLKVTQGNEQVRLQWARYQLASAALKRETTHSSLDLGLAHRVRNAIELEATYSLSSSHSASEVLSKVSKFDRFWQPVAGLAVAASVTVIMVLGAQRISMAEQPLIIPAQQGVVLLEPRNTNNSIALSSTGAAHTVAVNTNDIIRLPAPVEAANAAEANWLAAELPVGFVLTQRSVDVSDPTAREVLTYSNGVASFTLYVEALNGRTIAEGHAFAGSNLVLGQSMDHNGEPIFVTLVGQLSLAQAEHVANSVVSLLPQ
jgi:sigma-E factor negative regulatory protein RseA